MLHRPETRSIDGVRYYCFQAVGVWSKAFLVEAQTKTFSNVFLFDLKTCTSKKTAAVCVKLAAVHIKQQSIAFGSTETHEYVTNMC